MYEYKANITKVVDGDTVDATVDLGFGIFTILRLRLMEINTEELTDKNMEKRAMAVAAKERVQALLLEQGTNVIIRTVKDKKEKYGRYLASIILSDGRCLNSVLFDEGLAAKVSYE
jgi:micrococcal nuclease